MKRFDQRQDFHAMESEAKGTREENYLQGDENY
jgi:hypothetical protein